jgi:hypothetical protein
MFDLVEPNRALHAPFANGTQSVMRKFMLAQAPKASLMEARSCSISIHRYVKRSQLTDSSEHLKRCHSSQYNCRRCHIRYPGNAAGKVRQARLSHQEQDCMAREEQATDPELMTDEQEKIFQSSTTNSIIGNKNSMEVKWGCIYRYLFLDIEDPEPVPGPCKLSSVCKLHLLTDFRL